VEQFNIADGFRFPEIIKYKPHTATTEQVIPFFLFYSLVLLCGALANCFAICRCITVCVFICKH
jgi:hypothetical protein